VGNADIGKGGMKKLTAELGSSTWRPTFMRGRERKEGGGHTGIVNAV